MPRVLVFGTFDHLHPGHRFVLEEAGRRGDLFVVVARDRTVQQLKRRSSLQTEDERRSTIMAAFPNATVLLGNDDGDFLAPVRAVQPDLILLGYDQKLPPNLTAEQLACPTERLPAFEPEHYKSSLLRRGGPLPSDAPASGG